MMTCMIGLPQELLGTIPGWITSGGVIAGLGILVKRELGLKKLSIDSSAQEATSESAIRDHYSKEVARLTSNLTELEARYRKLLDESEARHEKCVGDRDALREQVDALEDKWRGLLRVVTQASIDKVLLIPGIENETFGNMRDVAERVDQIIRDTGRDPKKTDRRNQADRVEEDANQTARSATAAREHIEREEEDENGFPAPEQYDDVLRQIDEATPDYKRPRG
jgi:hypothetical protein